MKKVVLVIEGHMPGSCWCCPLLHNGYEALNQMGDNEIMYDEHIQMINEWFDKHDDYGTYHVDDEYAVRIGNMGEFRDLIAEIPDLIYIPCDFGTEGIFFRTEDLENARYY